MAGEQQPFCPPDQAFQISPFSDLPNDNKSEKPDHQCGVGASLQYGGNATLRGYEINIDQQHRGQDSTGIVAIVNGKLIFLGGDGLVKDVFPHPEELPSSTMEINHVRYGTSGREKEGSPVIATFNGRSVAVAHNGNIPEELSAILRSRIPQELHGKLTFDSAEIAYAICCAPGEDFKDKIKNALAGIPMAYALTILTDDGRIFGAVGPSGHWPLWIGQTPNGIELASETRAFPAGAHTRKVQPGELVELTARGFRIERFADADYPVTACALHDAYGAKSDSQRTEGEYYSTVRQGLGAELAREHPIVGRHTYYAGVPQSGLDSAGGYVNELGTSLSPTISLSTDRRTFIEKTLAQMQQLAREKYDVDEELVRKMVEDAQRDGEVATVVILDDSIIRGTTTSPLVMKLKALGVGRVIIGASLPRVLDECNLGYNIKKNLGLLALDENGNERSPQQMAEAIGADGAIFLSIDGLRRVLGENICTECMQSGATPSRRQLTSTPVLVQN